MKSLITALIMTALSIPALAQQGTSDWHIWCNIQYSTRDNPTMVPAPFDKDCSGGIRFLDSTTGKMIDRTYTQLVKAGTGASDVVIRNVPDNFFPVSVWTIPTFSKSDIDSGCLKGLPSTPVSSASDVTNSETSSEISWKKSSDDKSASPQLYLSVWQTFTCDKLSQNK